MEGEALAVAWALHKTRHFTLGNEKLTVAVDHKPLLKILGDRELADIDNPRILNFKQKTLCWRLEVVHVPGKEHHVADAMSRFPVEPPKGDESWKPWEASKKRSCHSSGPELAKDTEELEDATKAALQAAVSWALEGPAAAGCSPAGELPSRGLSRLPHGTVHAATTHPRMLGTKEIDKTSALDPTLKELRQLVESGAQCRRRGLAATPSAAPHQGRGLHGRGRHRACQRQGDSAGGELLAALHRSHSGVASMQARARESMFWPGMNSNIQRTRDECETCRQIAPRRPPTMYSSSTKMLPHILTSSFNPFTQCFSNACDLIVFSKHFLPLVRACHSIPLGGSQILGGSQTPKLPQSES